MSFQFGNLPYGYNPFSTGMTTLGGAYGDTPVWNLADSQVQSQMTGALFANMTPMYNSGFNSQVNNSTDFYNNLLMNQARMGGFSSQNSGSKMMQDLFQMMIMMKQLEKLNNTSEKSSSTSSKTDDYKTIEGIDDEGNGSKTDVKHDFKFDEKKPLDGLKSFIKNTNDDSTFEFADFKVFQKVTFDKLKDKENKVKLKDILSTFGVQLTSEERKNIGPSLAKDINNVTETEYNEFLNKLGFDSYGELSKTDFDTNVKELKEGIKTAPKEGIIEIQKEANKKVLELQEILGSEYGSDIRTNKKQIHDVFKTDDPQKLLTLLETLNKNSTSFAADNVAGSLDFLTSYSAGVTDATFLTGGMWIGKGDQNRSKEHLQPLLSSIALQINNCDDDKLKIQLQTQFDKLLNNFQVNKAAEEMGEDDAKYIGTLIESYKTATTDPKK